MKGKVSTPRSEVEEPRKDSPTSGLMPRPWKGDTVVTHWILEKFAEAETTQGNAKGSSPWAVPCAGDHQALPELRAPLEAGTPSAWCRRHT